ncbi:hypothetical protein HY495_03920 [Candidatus Woesearchaeota archaeon]|nr:hypothetical protein [Candidatus Woesearchaeota archaeon]
MSHPETISLRQEETFMKICSAQALMSYSIFKKAAVSGLAALTISCGGAQQRELFPLPDIAEGAEQVCSGYSRIKKVEIVYELVKREGNPHQDRLLHQIFIRGGDNTALELLAYGDASLDLILSREDNGGTTEYALSFPDVKYEHEMHLAITPHDALPYEEKERAFVERFADTLLYISCVALQKKAEQVKK